jgi:hypothetical protein
LVTDAEYFFELMSNITNNLAFQEPVLFTSKSGRTQIDSPSWIERVESTYLSVWIAGLLEENLWAHYNFNKSVNIDKNVRKNELHSLFEARSETL